MNENMNIAEVMKDGDNKAISTVVSVGGAIVYLSAIIYAETHGISMLTRGVSADFLVWAVIGMVALGVTAILLPLALHKVFVDPTQRLLAFMFYALDISLMAANAAADFALNTDSTGMPWWLQAYISFVVPMTPVVAGLGWSILWFFDPSQKEHVARSRLKAAARQAVVSRVVEAARSENLNLLVNQAAETMARQDVEAALGIRIQIPEKVASIPEGGMSILPANASTPKNGKVTYNAVSDFANPTMGRE